MLRRTRPRSASHGRRPWTRRRVLGITELGLAVVLAGCGSGAAPPASPSPPTATTAPAPVVAAKQVRIAGFEYRPVQLIVRRGTRVTWVNADTTDHTVTFTKSPRDLGNVDPGKRLSARFRTPGRYAYVCQYHPSMHGAVVVW